MSGVISYWADDPDAARFDAEAARCEAQGFRLVETIPPAGGDGAVHDARTGEELFTFSGEGEMDARWSRHEQSAGQRLLDVDRVIDAAVSSPHGGRCS